MKKSALKLLTLGVVLSFAACDKEYTCVCTNTATGVEISRTTISAVSASDAAEACDERESLFTPDICLIEE